MPHDGVIFIAGRSRRGSQKLVWAVMAITAIATDVRINAREVPKPIRRRAYELFEAIAIATGCQSRASLWPTKRVTTMSETSGTVVPLTAATNGRSIKFTPERLEQIKNLVERGMSREQIAERRLALALAAALVLASPAHAEDPSQSKVPLPEPTWSRRKWPLG